MSTAPKLVQSSDGKGQSSGHNHLIGYKNSDSKRDNRNITAEPMSRVDWIWDPRNRTLTLLAAVGNRLAGHWLCTSKRALQ
jgi:hypothetical protein